MTDKQTVTIVYTPQIARDWLEQHVQDAQGALQAAEDEFDEDGLDEDGNEQDGWNDNDNNELDQTHQNLEDLFQEAEQADSVLGGPGLSGLYLTREHFMARVKHADPEVEFPAWVDG